MTTQPQRYKLTNVPYLSQLDNKNRPLATCNVTSVAMCMMSQGIVGNGRGQLEDQLYDICQRERLDIHSPYDLQKLFAYKKVKDRFEPNATWSAAKLWLLSGKPVIAHGYFTRSGHILVIIGYTPTGFIVHDPYGEWFPSGYDTTRSGKELAYSCKMMTDCCVDALGLWLHFVG